MRLFISLIVLTLGWSLLFANFLISVRHLSPSPGSADGIVVLTGGPKRIDEGFKALSDGRAERLLISGVNQQLDNATVLHDLGQDATLLECCVDAEDSSTNTLSNAREALAWAHRKGYRSIILITADFHMLRSLKTFRLFDKEIQIIPDPVKAEVKPLTLAMEFNKYLLSLARGWLSP